MLTVDFDRLGLRPGDRVLDMGCGAGRHAFEMYRRGADVVAFDQDADELAGVLDLFGAMSEAGEVPDGRRGRRQGGRRAGAAVRRRRVRPGGRLRGARAHPRRHEAIAELVRVLRPGGTIAVTVPRWLPEKVCWALSDDYHEVEGGHIRIYTGDELVGKLRGGRPASDGTPPRARPARAVLVAQVRGRRRQRRAPAGAGVPPAAGLGHHEAAAGHPARRAGRSNPLIGKSIVLYLRKPRVGRREPRARCPCVAGRARPPHEVAADRGVDRRRCRSPTAPSRGRRASTSTRGTTSRRRWRCSSAARSRPPSAPTTGAWRTQRADGSWPMKIVARRGRGRQRRDQHVAPTSRSASGTTGWSPATTAFVRRLLARRAPRRWTSWSRMQLPVRRRSRWSREADGTVNDDGAADRQLEHLPGAALPASRSPSCVDEPQPEWELAGGRLGHALREHRDLFLDKSTFSMDWYYPVLGGAVRGDGRRATCSTARWDDFVVPGPRASAASTPTRG